MKRVQEDIRRTPSGRRSTAIPCEVPGCSNIHRYGDGYCHEHRQQAKSASTQSAKPSIDPAAKASLDHLHVGGTKSFQDYVKALNTGMEIVHFSDEVVKINRKEKKQKRCLVITNVAVYNFALRKYRKAKRRIQLQKLSKLLIPEIEHGSVLAEDRGKFMICTEGEYDYRLASARLEKLVNVRFHEPVTDLRQK